MRERADILEIDMIAAAGDGPRFRAEDLSVDDQGAEIGGRILSTLLWEGPTELLWEALSELAEQLWRRLGQELSPPVEGPHTSTGSRRAESMQRVASATPIPCERSRTRFRRSGPTRS